MTRLLLTLLLALSLSSSPALSQEVFEVPTLNEGLGEPPARIDRDTPHGAMESFLRAAEAGNWDAAAHLLDLSDYPTVEQAARGPLLARELAEVLDRKVVLNWEALLDRPDGLDARGSSDDPVAGQSRRSLLLAYIDLGPRPVSLRLNRLQPDGGDPVWVLPAASVANIEPLHDRFGPSTLERSLPAWARAEPFGGLAWWELLALPLMIVGIAWLGRRVWVGSERAIAALPWAWTRDLGHAMRAPLTILAMLVAVDVLVGGVFVFSGAIDAVLSPILAVGYVLAVLLTVINVGDVILDRLVSFEGDDLTEATAEKEHKRALATKVGAARRALIVVIVLVGAGLILSQAELTRGLGLGLLGSAGALTLVLGFAARRVLGNIMSSLQISLNQSARIGDKVMFQGYLCSVERINFTFVQLRVWTGERLVVPVEEFVTDTYENWTLADPAMIRTLELKFAHGADVDALRDIYETAMDEVEGELGPREDRGVHVTAQDVFGKTVLFKVPCEDPNTAWTIACNVREAILAKAARMEDAPGEVFPDASPAEAA
ncbi:MAG: mechanosensitive ion channel domain-containing protein [Paracoccaceae bacterium]